MSGTHHFHNRQASAMLPRGLYDELKRQSDGYGVYMSFLVRAAILSVDVGDLWPDPGFDPADIVQPRSGKRRGGDDDQVQVGVTLTDAEFEVLARAAWQRGLTRGEYIRRKIADLLAAGDEMAAVYDEMTTARFDAIARDLLAGLHDSRGRTE